jgi:hypothetical protein
LNDQFGTILLDVANNSNLPIEIFNFIISLENPFSVLEKVAVRIDPGQSSIVTLNTGIPIDQSSLSTLCVTVNTDYDEIDENEYDNESCLTVSPTIVFEPPYPNPAKDELTIKVILPDEEGVSIRLLNISGRIEIDRKFDKLESGLNTFLLDLSRVGSGIYFLQIESGGHTNASRIVVQ